MENLKVGDKVYNINNKWGKAIYNISTVIRVTKTLAILENGVRLINEEAERWTEYGNTYKNWELITPQIEKEIKSIQSMQNINRWFKEQIFTDEQKKIIYNQFKN